MKKLGCADKLKLNNFDVVFQWDAKWHTLYSGQASNALQFRSNKYSRKN